MSDLLASLSSLDLSTVETAMPVLPAGLYPMTVKNVTTEPNKAGNGNLLKIELSLAEPTISESGKPVNVGFPCTTRISLTETEKYNPRENLARFMEGVLGRKDVPFLPLEQFIGQSVTVRLAINDDAQYGRRNEVKGYIKKTV